jgi:hypothetical protein
VRRPFRRLLRQVDHQGTQINDDFRWKKSFEFWSLFDPYPVPTHWVAGSRSELQMLIRIHVYKKGFNNEKVL